MRLRFLAFAAVLGLLSACDSTGSLKELRELSPTGDAYQKALALDYRTYAEQKVARYDWWTAKYFADKGLMAAYGRDIMPEDPANWDTPATMAAQFADARSKLMAAIINNRSTQPELTASAVVAYDRWVELQHNQWNDAAIEEQHDAFFAILTKLEEVHTDSSPKQATDDATDASNTSGAKTPVESTSTILYFPLNSAKIGDSAKAAMVELVRYVQSAGNVSVVINGHADRAGAERFNMKLSQQRAKFVMEALKAAGVPEKIMSYFAFGETDPAMPTKDGVAEPKNRRVEIFIE